MPTEAPCELEWVSENTEKKSGALLLASLREHSKSWPQGVEVLRDAMLEMWESEMGTDFTPQALARSTSLRFVDGKARLLQANRRFGPFGFFPEFFFWGGGGVKVPKGDHRFFQVLWARKEINRWFTQCPWCLFGGRFPGLKKDATTHGCGSRNRCQNGTLVSGNMDQNLRNPPCVILSHTHMGEIYRLFPCLSGDGFAFL